MFLEPENVSNFSISYLIESKPDDNRVTKLADFLVGIYIYIGSEAIFPSDMWASASVDTYLITSVCKSFQAHFNSTHPNTFYVIEI